jgi:catechol 2,3-dioxygenase-like lactoylglutathione lyase family enzyme
MAANLESIIISPCAAFQQAKQSRKYANQGRQAKNSGEKGRMAPKHKPSMKPRITLITLGVAVMEQAKRAGAIIVKPAHATFWGGYAGYFQDPDAHLWEVAWNPQWVLQE